MRSRTPVARAARATQVAAFALALALSPSNDLHAQPTTSDVRVASSPTLEIPFEKITLPNGLVVIVSEDHTVPTVATNLMVKVGSRHEPAKRTGFAHLFEHLMFMGTERVPTGVFDERMESVGGSNNAWTSEDRTNYHDVAPSHAWPLLLWLEADRFEAVGRTMTAEKLETQRKIVRNERRQRTENEPYGKVDLRLSELLYPPTHPYHHPVIGSHEDLEAATVDDVKRFFADWYAPNNLALVVAGDVPAAEVKARVEAHFGGLPRVETPAAPPASPAKLNGVVRETIEDNVELGKIVMAWHSPAHFAPGDAELDLVASVLDRGKTSRLHKALVHEGELAQSVSAMQHSQELSSVFAIELVARPGVSLDALERAADDVVRKLVAEGVTAAELDRAKTEYETTFVRSLESVATRASLLNLYETSFGDPGGLDRDLARYRRATPSDVAAAAKATLDPNARVVIRVVPRAKPAKEVSK